MEPYALLRIAPVDQTKGFMMLRKGTKVSWSWAGKTATGTISEVFTDDVTRKIKGSEITRKASKDQPAYLIEQNDGDKVLKGRSEVER